MEDTLIQFKVAKLAKEKGFSINTTEYWEYQKEGSERYKFITEDTLGATWVNDDLHNRICITTQTLVQKWLREIHNIYVDAYFNADIINSTKVKVVQIVEQEEFWSDGTKIKSWKETFKKSYPLNDSKYQDNIKVYPKNKRYKIETFTYEEALEEGLYEALKLIKL